MRDRADYAGCEAAYWLGWDAAKEASQMFPERDKWRGLEKALAEN